MLFEVRAKLIQGCGEIEGPYESLVPLSLSTWTTKDV